MANTFFGFETSLPDIDTLPDADPDGDIDLVNDETFGDDDEPDKSWEVEHEKLQSHPDVDGSTGIEDYGANQEELGERICQMVVDDDYDESTTSSSSRIPSKGIVIPGCHRVTDLDELFNSESPSGLLSTEELITGQHNIWSLPNSLENQMAPGDDLKSILNSLHKEPPLQETLPPPANSSVSLSANLPNALTLEEIEREMIGEEPTPDPLQLPIGTPPRGHFTQQQHPSQSRMHSADNSTINQEMPVLRKTSPPLKNTGLSGLLDGGGEPRPTTHLYPGCNTPGLERRSRADTSPQTGSPVHVARDRSHSEMELNALRMRLLHRDPRLPPFFANPLVHQHGPLGHMMPRDAHFRGNMPHRPIGPYMDMASYMRASQRLPRPMLNQHIPFRQGFPDYGYGPPMMRGRLPLHPPEWRHMHPPHLPPQRPPPVDRQSNGVHDEYAELMTQREKDWIIHIQMLQLQTDNPYLDDFYYTTWMLKKSIQERRQRTGVQSEDAEDDHPKLILPHLTHVEHKAYKPVQFENSLGRITSSNVHCPRQIIDVHMTDMSDKDASKGHDVKRFKQVLLDIEKTYDILLRVDDMEKEALALPEEARARLLDERQIKITDMFTRLHCTDLENGEDNFVHFISIKKGLLLVSRMLPLLKKEEACSLISALIRCQTVISGKDWYKQALLSIYEAISRVMKTVNLENLVRFAADVKKGEKADGGQKALSQALQNTFGSSLIWCLVNRAEVVYETESLVNLNTDHQIAWCYFVEEVVEAASKLLSQDTMPCRPYTSYPHAHSHLSRLIGRNTAQATINWLHGVLNGDKQ